MSPSQYLGLVMLTDGEIIWKIIFHETPTITTDPDINMVTFILSSTGICLAT